ncbi:hypothetical protein BUGL105410_36165 [Burkholderia gladioli]
MRQIGAASSTASKAKPSQPGSACRPARAAPTRPVTTIPKPAPVKITPPHCSASCSASRRIPHCAANTKVQALTTPARKRTGSQNAKPGSRPIAAVSAMVASRPPRTMRASSIRIAAQLRAPTK